MHLGNSSSPQDRKGYERSTTERFLVQWCGGCGSAQHAELFVSGAHRTGKTKDYTPETGGGGSSENPTAPARAAHIDKPRVVRVNKQAKEENTR